MKYDNPHMSEHSPRMGNAFTRGLGSFGLKLTGWELVGRMPDEPKFVIIGVPHTSLMQPHHIIHYPAIGFGGAVGNSGQTHAAINNGFVEIAQTLSGNTVRRHTFKGRSLHYPVFELQLAEHRRREWI